MPGTRCTVALCTNSAVKTKEIDKNIMYHRFPKDPKIRKEWIHKTRRDGKWNPNTAFICSEHFTNDDYVRDLKAELLNISVKRKLKPTAIPSLKLKNEVATDIDEQRSQRMTKRQNKKLVYELLNAPSTSSSYVITPKVQAVQDTDQDHTEIVEEKYNPLLLKYNVLNAPSTSSSYVITPKVQAVQDTDQDHTEIVEEKYNPLLLKYNVLNAPSTSSSYVITPKVQAVQDHTEIVEEKYNTLLLKYNELKDNLNNISTTVNEQKQKIRFLEKELKENSEQANEKNFFLKVKEVLKDVLSQTQLDIILSKKRKVRWNVDDLSKAFAIRYFSKQCYCYLRDTLKYPLPSIFTLQIWASHINMRQGILNAVVSFMNIAGKDLSEFERCTVLSFDEVKVSSIYEYDKLEDEVIGPHSQMQVVMARGLFGKWKQPVYINFDQKMTKDILLNIISRLHEINYNVIACVSDCGGRNLGLWKSLDIHTEKPYFLHPTSLERIFIFPDAPHLLKLTRNWLLDTGFILQDNIIINKEPLESLIENTNTEISSCHKLNNSHINCVRTQRQNVSLAAQLLSHSTAVALKQYQPGDNKKLAIDTGNFIEKINSWFDLMNSYIPNDSLVSKRPYGSNLEEQNDIIDSMYDLISTMRCSNKRNMERFQKAILISLKSLRWLFDVVKEKYSASYILTHRLNQDCLENFFSQIRSRGGLHDHPSPLNAIYRIRIILGKNPGIVSRNKNTIDSLPDEYIVAQVLRKADINISNVSVQYKIKEESESSDTGSSTSLTVCNNSSQEKIQSESDGLEYLAGWVAKKLKLKHPSLGNYTCDTKQRQDHDYTLPSWLQSLSFGGLTEPSEEWLAQAKLIEKEFLSFHKKTFRKGKGVTRRLINKIVKKTEISEDIVTTFIRQRTFIRIKYFNINKKQESYPKRKAESQEQEKIQKKMRKIVN